MDRVVGSIDILVKLYNLPLQNEDKSCSSHPNKKALREPLIEIGVHTRRQDGISLSDRYVLIPLLGICEEGKENWETVPSEGRRQQCDGQHSNCWA